MKQTNAKIFILNILLFYFALGIFSNNRAGDVDSPEILIAYSGPTVPSSDCAVRLPLEISNVLRALQGTLEKSRQADASIDELYAFVDTDASIPVSCKTVLGGIKAVLAYVTEHASDFTADFRDKVINVLTDFYNKLGADITIYASISGLQSDLDKRLSSETKGGEVSITGNHDQDIAMFVRAYDKLESIKSRTMIVDREDLA